MSKTDLLSIGGVAAATGATVSALRYYDEIGLIDVATRVGGKRRFEPDVVGRVRFVQRAQQAGFSLEEIGLLLDDTAGDWREVVDAKLAELAERRTQLDQMIDLLTEIRTCGCQVVATCERMPTGSL